jgi:acetoin utilization deacetylase AcuC-like enzyme
MTILFTSSACLEHDVPFGYPERPERLERLLRGSEREIREVEEHPRTGPAIAAVHDAVYLERFERAVARGDGLLSSADNPLSPGTHRAAKAAVDAILAASDWTVDRSDARPFVAVRPPGHHAEHASAMGFCYLNNVAIAARYLIESRGLERVAIFDFDVHHGNGTQHLFEESAVVLYASVHQWPFYPGTGAESERGRGEGEGTTTNVCLAAGSGDDEYREAIEGRILPAIEDFRPQALLVSAGFDAWRRDPLGGMRVSLEGYAEWGVMLRRSAAAWCAGRLLSVLEGGYDIEALSDLVDAYLG